jgi:hypothetical protein
VPGINVTDVVGKDPKSMVGVTGFEPATPTSRMRGIGRLERLENQRS